MLDYISFLKLLILRGQWPKFLLSPYIFWPSLYALPSTIVDELKPMTSWIAAHFLVRSALSSSAALCPSRIFSPPTQTHTRIPIQSKFCSIYGSPFKNNFITQYHPNEFNKKSAKEFLQGSFTNFHVSLNSFHYYIHGTLYFSIALP